MSCILRDGIRNDYTHKKLDIVDIEKKWERIDWNGFGMHNGDNKYIG